MDSEVEVIARDGVDIVTGTSTPRRVFLEVVDMTHRLSPEVISDSENACDSEVPSVSLEVIEISSDENSGLTIQDGHRRTHNTTVGDITNKNTLCAPEVIELSDSDSYDTSSDFPQQLTGLVKSPVKVSNTISKKVITPAPKEFLPLYVDESDADDGFILILNEPRGTRKPIRRSRTHKTFPSSPLSRHGQESSDSHSSKDNTWQPHVVSLQGHGLTPRMPPKNSARKKAEEQARRERYAEKLFAELNSAVFNDGLPPETKLNWNKRLLTTAGRARWHKSRDGVQTTEIELATKILDCDERIRNTLSHEMCHLACWIINADPKEGHGRAFKSWAQEVMTKRPEIAISTRHNYEISYPFEWKCEKCSKIYGRYSKSIRPDECVCGICKVGKLVPLFVQRAPRTPKVSKMAVALPQGSPRPLAVDETTPIPTNSTVHDISSEDEVDKLVGGIKNVAIHEGNAP